MTAVDFTSILQQPVDDIKKPEPVPYGPYGALIKKFNFDKSSKKETPFVEYETEITQILEGVDPDLLSEYQEKMGKSPIGKKFSVTFYLTPDSLWRLKQFLEEHVGLDSTGKTLEQLVGEAVNNEVGLELQHSIGQKSGESFAEIKRTFNLNEV